MKRSDYIRMPGGWTHITRVHTWWEKAGLRVRELSDKETFALILAICVLIALTVLTIILLFNTGAPQTSGMIYNPYLVPLYPPVQLPFGGGNF